GVPLMVQATAITPQMQRAYDEDGVVCLRQAFDPHWLEVAARAIAASRAKPGPMHIDYSRDTRPGTYETDFWVWQRVPEMCSFIFDSPAAALVGELMGSRS